MRWGGGILANLAKIVYDSDCKHIVTTKKMQGSEKEQYYTKPILLPLRKIATTNKKSSNKEARVTTAAT